MFVLFLILEKLVGAMPVIWGAALERHKKIGKLLCGLSDFFMTLFLNIVSVKKLDSMLGRTNMHDIGTIL